MKALTAYRTTFLLFLASLAMPFAASAAVIDVTAATSAISDALAPVAAIGAAVLLVVIAIKTWKWVKRAG